jgi:hypothetical protein
LVIEPIWNSWSGRAGVPRSSSDAPTASVAEAPPGATSAICMPGKPFATRSAAAKARTRSTTGARVASCTFARAAPGRSISPADAAPHPIHSRRVSRITAPKITPAGYSGHGKD